MTGNTAGAGPELVIFDCDGMLVDSEVLSADLLVSELSTLGADIDRDFVFTHLLGRSFPTVVQIIRKTLDLSLPADFEATFRNKLLQRFDTDLAATPGVAAALSRVNAPICVATSSSEERAMYSLDVTGLSRFFTGHVFTASQVARGKPAPDLFELAALQMGAAPARTVVIEDSEAGIAAAHAAGMSVLRYVGGLHLRGARDLQDPSVLTFDRWDDFPAVLKKLSL